MNNKIFKYKIGIDEVGRGPVAGPVAVCATLIKTEDEEFLKKELEGMTDSKKLSEKKREKLFEKIKKLKKDEKIKSSVSTVQALDIDKIGIVPSIQKSLNASLEKITKNLNKNEIKVLLDGGLKCSKEFKNQETIIKGDLKEFVISVASVTAKVLRDRLMVKYSEKYPNYFFQNHKGYGTKAHMEAIEKNGLTILHRKSFLKKYF